MNRTCFILMRGAAVAMLISLLAGCQVVPLASPPPPPAQSAATAHANGAVNASPTTVRPAHRKKRRQLVKIVGIGYGSESTYDAYTPGQRRLMAIRASKLDAYRSLAEQIQGIKIDSNTTVSALMAKSDNFRARVNAIIRGARVVSVTPMPDHNYETVLEVYVDRDFFRRHMVYTRQDIEEDGPEIITPQQMQCDAHFNCGGR